MNMTKMDFFIGITVKNVVVVLLIIIITFKIPGRYLYAFWIFREGWGLLLIPLSVVSGITFYCTGCMNNIHVLKLVPCKETFCLYVLIFLVNGFEIGERSCVQK